VGDDAAQRARRRYVRIDELSFYTSLRLRHLHDLTRLGEIPHLRVGAVVLYDLEAIDAWLAAHRVEPAPRDRRPKWAPFEEALR